ncbi:MAG: FG-GAP repeat protein [candidate division BRC1 bacterium ADurb.BinA364]|nr:MAG: FG-GAP repeat protein [candidate division BRC1 bacterium ADurb.BinA364]
MDLVCADNQKNLLYFLMQQAEGERRFRIVEEPCETLVGSLALGDFNGDGRLDLALGGQEAFIRYQSESGVLGDSRKLDEGGAFALAADLNGDERTDLALIDPERTALFLQGASGVLNNPLRLRHAVKAAPPPLCFDLDGDGRDDLMYRDAETADQIAIRYQSAGAGLGPEIVCKAGFAFSIAGAAVAGEGGAALAATENKTQMLKIMRLGPGESREGEDLPMSLMRRLPYANEKETGAVRLALGDLRGDSALEILSLAESLPALDAVSQSPGGALERRTIPALLGARKIRISRDSRGSIAWMLSAKEKTIGAGRIAGGEMEFPQPLELGAEPQAFDLADFDGSGFDDLAVVASAAGKTKIVVLYDPAPGALAEARRGELALADTGAELDEEQIEEMIAADLNRDGRPDLALFPDYGDPILLAHDGADGFQTVLLGGASQGQFEGLAPSQLLIDDWDGDGLNEILAAKSSFVRVLSMESGGGFRVLAQLNGKSGSSQIAAVALGDLDGDGRRETILLDRASQCATVYGRGEGGELALRRHIPLEPLAAQTLLCGDIDGNGRDDLIAGAANQFAILLSGVSEPAPKRVAERRSEVENGGYRLAAMGDLVSGGGAEIAALENKERLLEFFQLDAGNELRRIYKFKVFSGEGAHGFFDPAQARPPEPREILFPDFDGDGRNDLALIVHDKAIVYRQLAPDETE